MKRLALCIIAAAIFACDVPKNLRQPESPDSSIIGISLTIKLMNAMPKKQTSVYFVRLEDKDENYLGTNIIPANYLTGNYMTGYYAYLINARPGKYAAICSTKIEEYTTSSYEDKNKLQFGLLTFFDENILKKTYVEVGPSQVAFMGKYTVNSQLKSAYMNIEKNGDRAQQHYYNQLKQDMEGTFYCGTAVSADRSNKTTREFLLKMQNNFKKSGWANVINTALESFDKTE